MELRPAGVDRRTDQLWRQGGVHAAVARGAWKRTAGGYRLGVTKSSDEWYETALELREQGKLNDAIVAASAALGEDGDRVDARHILGAMLLEAGHHEAAAAELSRVKT